MKTSIFIIVLILATMSIIGAFPKVTQDLKSMYALENEVEKPSLFGKVPEQTDVKMLVVGDMMFDRSIARAREANGGAYIFSCVADYLNSFDVVVGNLEGTITKYPSRSLNTKPGEPGNTTFTFSTSTGELLRTHNIGVVSLANNHILDFGREGASSTKRFLEESGVDYFGDPLDVNHKSLVMSMGGRVIAFIGFNQFLGVDSVESTISEIGSWRSLVDNVIVYAHWGDEYVAANDSQKTAAHAFIDAGADVVIGSHPHIIQENEIYKEKNIYYSLGNFIFDQYWEEKVSTGLGLEMIFGEGGISFSQQLFTLERGGRTCIKTN